MEVGTKFRRRLNLELRFQYSRSKRTQNRKLCRDGAGLLQKILGKQVIIVNKNQKLATGLLDATESCGG
jgi:hypothetical protein